MNPTFEKVLNFFRSKKSQDLAKIAADVGYSKASYKMDIEVAKAISEIGAQMCQTDTESYVDVGILVVVKIRNVHGEFSIFGKRLTIIERTKIDEAGYFGYSPKHIYNILSSGDKLRGRYTDN